jgi:hypothetical protein
MRWIYAIFKQVSFNLLKPTGNFTYHKSEHSKFLHCDHMEFVCVVCISEKTANFALHNNKRLVSLHNTDKFRLSKVEAISYNIFSSSYQVTLGISPVFSMFGKSPPPLKLRVAYYRKWS